MQSPIEHVCRLWDLGCARSGQLLGQTVGVDVHGGGVPDYWAHLKFGARNVGDNRPGYHEMFGFPCISFSNLCNSNNYWNREKEKATVNG